MFRRCACSGICFFTRSVNTKLRQVNHKWKRREEEGRKGREGERERRGEETERTGVGGRREERGAIHALQIWV
jgi:hypothetical protein